MLTIVAKLRAQPGKGGELAAEMSKVAEAVRRNEPGNDAYALHRGSEDPDLIMVYERYVDEAALQKHREHLKSLGGNMASLMAGRPELEYFEALD